ASRRARRRLRTPRSGRTNRGGSRRTSRALAPPHQLELDVFVGDRGLGPRRRLVTQRITRELGPDPRPQRVEALLLLLDALRERASFRRALDDTGPERPHL